MTIEHFGAESGRPLAASVRAGDWLFVSGQASTDPVTAVFVPGTFEEEFGRSVDNLLRVLSDAGARYEQVTKICAYVRDESDLPHYNELYLARFAHPRPARTTSTMGFGFLKFELDAVAYVGP